MVAARDLCKQQTAEVEELRQWQVGHAETALKAIVAHGSNDVWTTADCVMHAEAALRAMRRPIGEPDPGMLDA